MKFIETLPFGPYSPDNPDLYNPGLEGAVNVIPRQSHFEPLRAQVPIATTPLPARPIGAYSCFDSLGNAYLFSGTSGAIYQLSGNSWNDVSRVSPAYDGSEDRWEFAKWGDTVIATSFGNDLQTITLGASNFTDLVSGIQAHHVAVVRDFVMIGDVIDQDGTTPNRVRWCAFRDPSDWTPSASTQADFRDLEGQSTESRINRIIGGEYALVFLSDAIWRLTYVGSPQIFQLDEVDPDVGTISESSIVQHAGKTYFLAEDGFRITRGGISESIGHQKINRDVLQRLDYNHLDRIRCATFKEEQVIVWALPGPNNIAGRPNFLVIYNFVHDRWSGGEIEVEQLFHGVSPFTSFDDPVVDDTYGNLDNIPGSADDSIWAGSNSQFMSFNDAFQVCSWTGEPLEALFTTGEKQFFPGRRAAINEIQSLVDGGTGVQVSIGHRNRQSDPIVWTPERGQNSRGVIPHKISARYMRFRAKIPAGTLFEDTVGLDIFGHPDGA